MSRHSRMTVSMCVLAGLALLAGCGEPTTIDTGSGVARVVDAPRELVAKSQPTVSDLPEPVGFDLDEGSSDSQGRTAGLRWVRYRFTGRADKWAVKRFYNRQMPASGWKLESERFFDRVMRLNFGKANEACEIRIGDGGFLSPTEVRIDIYPRSM